MGNLTLILQLENRMNLEIAQDILHLTHVNPGTRPQFNASALEFSSLKTFAFEEFERELLSKNPIWSVSKNICFGS